MELIDRVNSDVWSKLDCSQAEAWPEYTIITCNMVKPGEFKVAIKQLTEEGDIPHLMADLRGCCGKTNPLQHVRNCQLLVVDEEIVGMLVVDDGVLKKTAEKI